jgi:hypothetical protein
MILIFYEFARKTNDIFKLTIFRKNVAKSRPQYRYLLNVLEKYNGYAKW